MHARQRPGSKHYPPAYTPLSIDAIARAAMEATVRPRDAVARLEEHLRQQFAADHVILFGSGTQALTAAIEVAFRVGSGSNVVALPAYNCYDLASAAIGAGARIAVYDIDPDTLAPDWDSFESVLASGVGAAVVAPLYGLPIDWERAESIAAAHGTVLIEDAAQGIGGSWRGAPLGTLGRISILSFGRGKGWTGGGGGALLLRGVDIRLDPPPPPALEGLRTGIATTAQWLLSDPRMYSIPASIPWLHLGETVYKPPRERHGMPPFAAALLLCTAQDATSEAAHRAAAGLALHERFAETPNAKRVSVADNGAAGYLRFPLRVSSQSLRARILTGSGRAGVAHAYPGSIADLPAVRSCLSNAPAATPGASALARELITLPTHSRSDRLLLESISTVLP